MGSKRWNARAWQDAQLRRVGLGKKRMGGTGKAIAAIGILTLLGVATGVVGVVHDNQAVPQEMIGLCHATGSAENSYVFLVVPKDGFEHGHHRHHDADFFRDPSVGNCDNDAPADATTDAPANGTQTPAEDATNASEPADEPPAANDTTPSEEENPTTPPDDNATTVDENATSPDNGTPAPPPPGDVAASQGLVQDDEKVDIVLAVRNVGEGASQNVSLVDDLPDLRRAWLLSGPDADGCTLEGLHLWCWFGDLDAGAERIVNLSAYTDRLPCGNHRNNTVYDNADADAQLGNNAATRGITARSC